MCPAFGAADLVGSFEKCICIIARPWFLAVTVWWNCWHTYVLWVDFLNFTLWGVCRDKRVQSSAVEEDSSGHENTCCGRSGKIVALYRKPLTSENVLLVPLTALSYFSQRFRFLCSQWPGKHYSTYCLARQEVLVPLRLSKTLPYLELWHQIVCDGEHMFLPFTFLGDVTVLPCCHFTLILTCNGGKQPNSSFSIKKKGL